MESVKVASGTKLDQLDSRSASLCCTPHGVQPWPVGQPDQQARQGPKTPTNNDICS